jgi:hypothetical protein
VYCFDLCVKASSKSQVLLEVYTSYHVADAALRTNTFDEVYGYQIRFADW